MSTVKISEYSGNISAQSASIGHINLSGDFKANIPQDTDASGTNVVVYNPITKVFEYTGSYQTGGGAGVSTDISALNTFTGSIQTQVDNLTNATSSYLTGNDTGSFLTTIITSSFITADQTSSFIINTSSFITADQTGSNFITTASITNFPTEVSRSAAAAGFGTGGGGGFTPSLSTDITARNITASSNISSSGDIYTTQLYINNNDAPAIKSTLPYWILPGELNIGGWVTSQYNTVTPTHNTRLTGLNIDMVPSGGIAMSSHTDGDRALYINYDSGGGKLTKLYGSWEADNISLTSITASGAISASGDLYANNLYIEDKQALSWSSGLSLGTFGVNTTKINGSGIQLTGNANMSLTTVGVGNITISAADNFSITADKVNINAPITASSNIKVNGVLSIPDFPNVSASLAAAGNGGGGGFTPSLSTDLEARNITASANISASGIVYGKTGSFSYLQGNSPIKVKDNITFDGNVTINGSKTTTDSLEVVSSTFKLGGGFFTSSSLAAAVGGGGDNLGNHTAEMALNMSTYNITNAGSITAVSLTGSISTSSIEGFNDSVSTLSQNVFDNRDQSSLDAINAFTGSIQTQVNNLTAVTGSYALTSSISGAFAETSSSFSSRVTTLETAGYLTDPITTSSITNFPTEVSRSAAAAGFGTGGAGGFTPSLSTDIEARNITASGVIETDKITSATAAHEINLNASLGSVALKVGGGDNYRFFTSGFRPNVASIDLGSSNSSYRWDNFYVNYIDVNGNISASGDLTARSITGSIATSSIENFPTEVSRSAAAAGFGTGGGGGFTPSLSSDITARNITASANISASGDLSGNNLILGGGTFTSASLAAAQAGGDNLGNHTATTDLNMSNNAIISASRVETDNITINGLGSPTIISNTNINLSASNAVVINSSPLRLSAYSNDATGSGFSAGDVYFNTDTSKFMGYNGTNHVVLG